ncbi:MAG: hypothetical protein QXO69_00525 [archaeon]
MFKISCDLMRTEDASKLKEMLKNFFPDAEFSANGGEIVGLSSLSHFKELCERQNSMAFAELRRAGKVSLDKMAMHAGVIAPCDEAPLGCVTIKKADNNN